uniref:Histidine kinase/HSP90-like ATPase domain-containing protein n=1 Tax=Setaria digitata TaxID=48799 RepID=A0A915Q275_9BILA
MAPTTRPAVSKYKTARPAKLYQARGTLLYSRFSSAVLELRVFRVSVYISRFCRKKLRGGVVHCFFSSTRVNAKGELSDQETVKENIGKIKTGSKTDDEVIQREEEAIKLDGLSVAEMKELRTRAEKHTFQAEADPENHMLYVTDTGIGMTKTDLVNNLGTIARSGTSEFLSKLLDSSTSLEQQHDMIGQFGVGFYSAYLVADRVIVTSKHNDDDQYIWESDSSSFTIAKDPRGSTLKRGTQVALHLKEEAYDFLEADTLKNLVEKYSQFINFNIYLWQSKTETVEEPTEEEEEAEKVTEEKIEDADGKVEEDKVEPKTKKVEKTTWDWEKINNVKPIWMRKSDDVEVEEYNEFYKSITKDHENPLGYVHFTAEGEVTFKSILYVPRHSPFDMFQNYGKGTDNIKLYVRRVFITDDFHDMMPKYLSFIRGIVDSDDLPLNVSRETLQQHKLLKVIKKKLVRKVLDMFKKMEPADFEGFWKEYSTNIKLGIMEDPTNRTRLAKLLRFYSSNSKEKMTSLAEYVSRMKDKQEMIFYVAGNSREEVESSPFVERLLKKGYEVLYLVEAVDEYAIQSMPEFDGKKFQNAAKEGLKIEDSEKSKEVQKQLEKEFEPLTSWLKSVALKDKIEKAVVSQRLVQSPCALVASSYGWSGNMERIMKSQAHAKSYDPTQEFYANQKKTFEINPRHPVIRELLRLVKSEKNDEKATSTALLLFETATLRSGFTLGDQVGFADRIEQILRRTMDVSLDEPVEEEPEVEEDTEGNTVSKDDQTEVEEEHSEL